MFDELKAKTFQIPRKPWGSAEFLNFQYHHHNECSIRVNFIALMWKSLLHNHLHWAGHLRGHQATASFCVHRGKIGRAPRPGLYVPKASSPFIWSTLLPLFPGEWAYVSICLCVHVSGGQRSHLGISLPYFLRQDLSPNLTWQELSIELQSWDCGRIPWHPPFVCCFCLVGSSLELGSSCLHSKHLTNWAISLGFIL